ncbi:MAG TPA: phosphoribosylformylglycinamidine synthase, partial [Peptostreptococcaceae bacterium]|nr:phosphoribosylformylglycinamidine synthase [Peptostreptococcaceae bacterium]
MINNINTLYGVRRILIEKKPGFDIEANSLYKDIAEGLNINSLTKVRIINRYDIEGISDEVYKKAAITIFSEPNVDNIYYEEMQFDDNTKVFGIEYLPGQYDQRGDWASQCMQIVNDGVRPNINTAKVIVLSGDITDEEFEKIKSYCINPVDSREASLQKPDTLKMRTDIPTEVEILDGFIDYNDEELLNFMKINNLAMTFEDLKHVQIYFIDIEKRNPTITEIKVVDTYWSDHCRHTTFLTNIRNIKIESGKYSNIVKKAYDMYINSREYVYGSQDRDIC